MSGEHVQIWYWVLTEAEYGNLQTYLGQSCPTFTQLSDGNYYILHRDAPAGFGDTLKDFDMDDGIAGGGENCFGTSYWTLSNVPAVFRP